MCGRPVEVPPRFAGKDFLHPLCGSTLRMSISGEGETDIELVSPPELEEKFTVDLDVIRKSESHGLFLPRHLRENSPLHDGKSIEQLSGEQSSGEESPGKASARLAKDLSQPAEGVTERIRKVRLIRGKSNSSHLRKKFNRTVEDLPGDISSEEERGRVDDPAGPTRQAGNQAVPLPGDSAASGAVADKMNATRKLGIVVFVFIILVVAILMMVNFVLGD